MILINTKPKPKSAIYMVKMSRKNVIKFMMRNVGILIVPENPRLKRLKMKFKLEFKKKMIFRLLNILLI